MYLELKESLNAEKRNHSYDDLIFTAGLSMFEYTKLSKEFTTALETYLLLLGQCAVWLYDDNLICTPCTRIGNINVYGKGKDLNCTTRNGINKVFYDFENSADVVYIRNNSTATPDNNIDWYATALAEIDKSIMHNVINSRYSPIVKARTDKERAVIETALEQNNGNGKPQVVLVGMENLFESNNETSTVLNITDVANSDKIQYLSHAHDDIIRRLCNTYGMDIKGTGKMAQQSVAEINNGDNSQLIIPEDRLNCRRLAVEEINSKFGRNITVNYSKCWKREDDERTTDETEIEVEKGEDENA